MAKLEITIRSIPSQDGDDLHGATDTIARKGGRLVDIPGPLKLSIIVREAIPKERQSFVAGGDLRRYEHELKPTMTGVQPVSFDVVDAAVHKRLIGDVLPIQNLLPSSSSFQTQLTAEEFLEDSPRNLWWFNRPSAELHGIRVETV